MSSGVSGRLSAPLSNARASNCASAFGNATPPTRAIAQAGVTLMRVDAVVDGQRLRPRRAGDEQIAERPAAALAATSTATVACRRPRVHDARHRDARTEIDVGRLQRRRKIGAVDLELLARRAGAKRRAIGAEHARLGADALEPARRCRARRSRR